MFHEIAGAEQPWSIVRGDVWKTRDDAVHPSGALGCHRRRSSSESGNGTSPAPPKNPPLAHRPKRTLVLLAFSMP